MTRPGHIYWKIIYYKITVLTFCFDTHLEWIGRLKQTPLSYSGESQIKFFCSEGEVQAMEEQPLLWLGSSFASQVGCGKLLQFHSVFPQWKQLLIISKLAHGSAQGRKGHLLSCQLIVSFILSNLYFRVGVGKSSFSAVPKVLPEMGR